MIKNMLVALSILTLTGCASTIKGVSLDMTDNGVYLMTKNTASGNLFINNINGTSTGDITRLLKGKLVYPSNYYLAPGEYSLSIRHEGGGYRPITGDIDLVVEKGRGYTLTNVIEEEKMYFWVEDSKSKERVAGWQGK